LAAVSPEKDVDGFQAINVGRAWLGQIAFVPAAAMAIREILTRNGYRFEGKETVIVTWITWLVNLLHLFLSRIETEQEQM